ncbi:MAG: hypothetical protein IIC03_09665, partial [Proteobacteria bacterium]|nr:hypothetical protein [Pseudomonadota bacterium]
MRVALADVNSFFGAVALAPGRHGPSSPAVQRSQRSIKLGQPSGQRRAPAVKLRKWTGAVGVALAGVRIPGLRPKLENALADISYWTGSFFFLSRM